MTNDVSHFMTEKCIGPRHSRLRRNIRCGIRVDDFGACIDRIWGTLVTQLSHPIDVTTNDRERVVTFMGALRFTVLLASGEVRAEHLSIDGGTIAFAPIDNVVIDLPARLTGAWLSSYLVQWSGALTDCMTGAGEAGQREELLTLVEREFQRAIDQHTHWRRLRHALRDVLCLDRQLLSSMRQGRHRRQRFRVTDIEYNRALAHRSQYRQILLENPDLLWLYNFHVELGIVLPEGDIVAGLKSRLLESDGVTEAAWRYLLRCNHRHFRHVIDFVGPHGDMTNRWTKLAGWLRWIIALDRRDPIHPEIIRIFEHGAYDIVTDGDSIRFRHAEMKPGIMRAILKTAESRHACGTLDEFITRDLTDVVTWLQTVRPNPDANQIRRGWPYLVREAEQWKSRLVLQPVLSSLLWDSLLPVMTFGQWTVLPITDAWTLREEALSMRHCADSYLGACSMGQCRIFSVRTNDGKRIATIGLWRRSGVWDKVDTRGFANVVVSRALHVVGWKILARYEDLARMIEPSAVRSNKSAVSAIASPGSGRLTEVEHAPPVSVQRFGRSRAVVVSEEVRSTIAGNWTDSVIVTRTQRKVFTVYARKHVEATQTSGERHWVTLERWRGLRTPQALQDALSRAEQLLELAFDWDHVVARVEELDWVVAAAMALQK